MIAARLPAEPGWRAMIASQNGSSPVLFVPIAAWGLVQRNASVAFSLGPAATLELVPIDADGRDLDSDPPDDYRLARIVPPSHSDEAGLIEAWLAFGISIEGWDRHNSAFAAAKLAELERLLARSKP